MGRRKPQTSTYVRPQDLEYENAKEERARNARQYGRNVQINDLTRMRSLPAIGAGVRPNPLFDEEPVKFEVNEKGGTFSDQFLATLQRSFRQKRRNWVTFTMEMLVPILFVVGAIILWAAFGDEIVPEKSWLNYSDTTASILPTYYQALVCNNVSMGKIEGLASCEATGREFTCDGDESSLPVKGLCHNTAVSTEEVVGIFVNSLLGKISAIPLLDGVIVHQWLARKSSSSQLSSAANALLSSGIAPNTRMNSILSSGNIYFAPAANVPERLIQYFNNESMLFKHVNGGTFATIEEANAHVASGESLNWCVIEIKALNKTDFDVEIHMNSSALPSLNSKVDIMYPGGFQYDRAELYMASGFSTIQRMLYDYHVKYNLESEIIDETNPYLVSMGSGSYRRKVLLETAAPLIAFILVLSFLYPVSQLTKQIVLEKELRIREAMLIMGLSNSALYLSWFVVYALQYLVECIVITVLLKVTFIRSSDPFILFAVFYLFALSTIPLSGLVASFFAKARLASMMGPLIYFVMAVPTFAFTSASATVILVFSILSPTGIAAILSNIMTLETSVGFGSSDMLSEMLEPKTLYVVAILAIDFVVYYLLMFYFDAVLPKDWGTTKHPLFFIIDPVKACVRCCKSKDSDAYRECNEDGRAEDGVFEDVDDADAAVRVVGLRKEYKRNGKKFAAVNNLYWGMKSGEISVLLGHNGAGKSTAMNMMMGMVQPDEGDCYINNCSVRHDLSRVRQQIGFCPQHNILWPDLSCREHLEYFGKIKGLSGSALEDAVRIMLSEVDLLDKMDYPSKALSGGMKRKLSVAIAFVGRSPLIFLDEPTAGMDVGARRYTWELLRRMSESHTIMLTTHYMDEADLLGHRIGIMSHGRLQCSGSSMFLKSRLGVGYNLSVTVDPDADAESIDQLVVSLVASAEAASYDGVEIMYKLPMEDVEQFPNLLAGLEQYGEEAGVRGYSLSASTLEEVFLKIAMDEKDKEDQAGHNGESEDVVAEENNLVWNCELMTSSCSRSHSQFRAMMAKRLWNAIRDRRMQCFQIVCPVACILLAMILTLVDFSQPKVTLDLSADMFDDEVEMEVSNCRAYFGDVNTTTRQGAEIYDHFFYNGLDMSLYTINTDRRHSKPRYTSMQCNDVGMIGAIGDTRATMMMYNTSAYHSAGLVLNQFYNFLVQNLTNDASHVLRTATSAMTDTRSLKGAQGGVQTILIGAIVMIPFTFLPSNPVAWVVKERECKARHLQNVSGLSFYVYWLANFIFDMTAYVITLLLVIIIFLIFQRKEYVSGETFGPTFIMFLVYGICSTLAAYALNFVFNEHSNAQTMTMAISFIGGFLLVMMVFILSLLDDTKQTSDYLRWVFRIMPSYCVGESIINLSMEQQKRVLGQPFQSAWALDVTGWPMIYMLLEVPVFLFLTLFIDHPRRRMWGQSKKYHREAPAEIIDDEDSDVEDERKAVYEAEDNNVNDDIVRVVDLRKVYSNGKVAVRNLTFSILPDEVFGFLGTNGAGKTTAISMLCQEFVPSSGCAYVCGYDIVDQSAEAIQCIGYCPQFDATLDLLTVEEHLYMYAGIRGIVPEQRDAVVTGLLRLCDILPYRKIKSCDLSGGNRRKLSVAMSLVGSPQVVLLDEPSAGMDPVARRSLWTTLQQVSQNSSIVLTTHHLEEVEALADTVAIMADGALRCIGDKTHLKTKYGSGFEMSIRIASKDMKFGVEQFVQQAFPEAILNEFKGQRFVYALPQDTLLSEAFRLLQENKDALGITDYSISQTSIEQVFLRISEEQEQRGMMKSRLVRFTDSHARLHHYRSASDVNKRLRRGGAESDTGDDQSDDDRSYNGSETHSDNQSSHSQWTTSKSSLHPSQNSNASPAVQEDYPVVSYDGYVGAFDGAETPQQCSVYSRSENPLVRVPSVRSENPLVRVPSVRFVEGPSQAAAAAQQPPHVQQQQAWPNGGTAYVAPVPQADPNAYYANPFNYGYDQQQQQQPDPYNYGYNLDPTQSRLSERGSAWSGNSNSQ